MNSTLLLILILPRNCIIQKIFLLLYFTIVVLRNGLFFWCHLTSFRLIVVGVNLDLIIDGVYVFLSDQADVHKRVKGSEKLQALAQI